jgi:DNA-binding protein H-NS
MAIDLSGMNRKDLEKLKVDVEKAIRDVAKNELKEARKAAEKAAAKFGYSLSELTGAIGKSAKKQPAAAKYANPDDASQTWSGRGRQPQWYKDAVSAGKSPSEMEL